MAARKVPTSFIFVAKPFLTKNCSPQADTFFLPPLEFCQNSQTQLDDLFVYRLQDLSFCGSAIFNALMTAIENSNSSLRSRQSTFIVLCADAEAAKLTLAKDHSSTTHISQAKSIMSFYSSAFYGNKKVFVPRWSPEFAFTDPQYFTPNKWTYLYDHSPLVKAAEKYIDYNKLQPNGKSNARLIITAVNVLNAEPLIFDSSKQQITSRHILAATGYPSYYFPWVEVEKGVYAWDGSLLSNTPLREVIDASPVKDKRFFLVENDPKKCDILPDNLLEVQHRARDIMFSDKTIHNIQMSKAITYYLRLIGDLYKMLEDQFSSEKKRIKLSLKSSAQDIKKYQNNMEQKLKVYII